MEVFLIILGAIAALALLVIILGSVCNRSLVLTFTEVRCKNLPEDFDGFRIAHISDLHNATFGENNKRLLRLIAHSNPHLIAITGDIIDSRHTHKETALSFASEVAKIAPVRYVTGNHESRFNDIGEFLEKLSSTGVGVLRNSCETLTHRKGEICLMGVEDPALAYSENFPHDNAEVVDKALTQLPIPSDKFTLLLCHRPELIEVYAKHNIDLVLTGHAHGGQARLPFIGGLYAPKQGFFPRYTSGIHHSKSTAMVISRGLGNSMCPLRIFNTPEVVLVTLKKA